MNKTLDTEHKYSTLVLCYCKPVCEYLPCKATQHSRVSMEGWRDFP